MILYDKEQNNMFTIVFTQRESENMATVLKGDVSLRNIQFMYFLEQYVRKLFSKLDGGRIMIMNVNYSNGIIAVDVMHQNIDIEFPPPKFELRLVKVTCMVFKSKEAIKQTLENDGYSYKIVNEEDGETEVNVLNVSIQDLLKYSLNANVEIIENIDII